MKKKIVVGGSIGVVVLLMLAMFPAVVSAQTIESNESQRNVFQYFIEKIKNKNLDLGGLIDAIRLVIFWFIIVTTLFFSGH